MPWGQEVEVIGLRAVTSIAVWWERKEGRAVGEE